MKLAGYFTLYRYYAHPDRERARFAHVLLLPPYRKSGVGAKFLSAVFDDICASDRILDTTAETPADAFVFLRDYVDCVRCKPLEEFSAENLRRGFNSAPGGLRAEEPQDTQTRRISELLRYYYAQTSQPEDMEAFEASVKKRLALPFASLVPRLHAHAERERAVAEGFKDTLEMYEQVLDRLRRFESHLF
ncbi:Histone acetyltransferase type B catalytic subunit [Aphelenchoides fujianensis]|nr:Histone acetyltransferase type B catalytic subunit [Aphelenchoides fujianensis]